MLSSSVAKLAGSRASAAISPQKSRSSSQQQSKFVEKFALVLLLFVVLELVLIGHQVQPVKSIKKKIIVKKIKKLLPIFALIKPKKKIILVPIPIPMGSKGPRNPNASPALAGSYSSMPNAPENSNQYTQQTMSAPMMASMQNPILASPTNEAMMGFMTNSMPAIIKMLPTQSNSTALAATAMTMTIHSPNEAASDAMALSNAMQSAMKAPLVASNSQNLAAGENYYSSPWRSRLPLSSPAKLFHSARNNFQQHQQLHQHQHQKTRIVSQQQQQQQLPLAPAHFRRPPTSNQRPSGELFRQQPIGGHEIEDFSGPSINQLPTSLPFQPVPQPIMITSMNNQLNDAFEQMPIHHNMPSHELNINNHDNVDDLFNQVELQTSRPNALTSPNSNKMPASQQLPSQQQSQQQQLPSKSTTQPMRSKSPISGGGY